MWVSFGLIKHNSETFEGCVGEESLDSRVFLWVSEGRTQTNKVEREEASWLVNEKKSFQREAECGQVLSLEMLRRPPAWAVLEMTPKTIASLTKNKCFIIE